MNEESILDEAIWKIDQSRTWPPSGTPSGPISPSLYETLTECPLRACFGCSSGYRPRISPRTRLGTAYHNTIARLPFLSHLGLTRKEMRAKAVTWFQEEVADQRNRAQRHPRESDLPWPEVQIEAMEISLALKANSIPIYSISAQQIVQQPNKYQSDNRPNLNLREEEIVSRDGLICGRPDLIENSPLGSVVVDYKTGSLDDEETRLRYVRQCLIYAWLWQNQHGQWPATYRVENPLREQVYEGPVDHALATEIVADMQRMAQKLPLSKPAVDLAHMGPHCGHCAYRPWCEPYWLWTNEIASSPANERDTQFVSLEGELIQFTWPNDAPQNVGLFYLQSKDTYVTIQVSLDKFSYLRSVPPGSRLRVIDAVLTHDASWLKLTSWSEAFVLQPL